jgi:hypothetical protein
MTIFHKHTWRLLSALNIKEDLSTGEYWRTILIRKCDICDKLKESWVAGKHAEAITANYTVGQAPESRDQGNRRYGIGNYTNSKTTTTTLHPGESFDMPIVPKGIKGTGFYTPMDIPPPEVTSKPRRKK